MLLSRFLRIKRSVWSAHLKASKCPAVVVLHVSFSYPVVSVRCSNRFKLNQMSLVVMRVQVARLSQRKVLLLLRFGVAPYLSLDGFGEPFACRLGCVLTGSWLCGTSLSVALGTRFMIWLPGGGSLFEMTSSPLGPL